MIRAVAAGFGVAALIGAASVPASPGHAHDGSCQAVTVVVDFGEAGVEAGLEDRPLSGCAEDPATGIEALTQAGFEVVEVASFPGAVCRVEGFPEADCGPMPPADAAWSYWRVSEGEWVYSNVGAGTVDPEDGDIEGWVFGDASAPPDLEPEAAVATDAAAESQSESGTSPTWMIAVVLLASIAGLVIWRLRRGRAA